MSREERVEQALFHLVTTPKGSYYSDLSYGWTIEALRTQGMQVSGDGEIDVYAHDLRVQAARYIPDCIIHDVVVEMDPDEFYQRVVVLWDLRGSQPKSNTYDTVKKLVVPQ